MSKASPRSFCPQLQVTRVSVIKETIQRADTKQENRLGAHIVRRLVMDVPINLLIPCASSIINDTKASVDALKAAQTTTSIQTSVQTSLQHFCPAGNSNQEVVLRLLLSPKNNSQILLLISI